MKFLAVLAFIIVAACVLTASKSWYYQTYGGAVSTSTPNGDATTTVDSASSSNDTALPPVSSWQVYHNTRFDFILRYPSTWKVDEQSGIAPNAVMLVPSGVVLNSFVKQINSYVSVEPESCESATGGPRPQTSTVVINGIPMEKIAINTPSETSTNRFTIFLFAGDPSHGWNSQCNTIRLYVPPSEPSANAAAVHWYTQDVNIENQILGSFALQS